MKMSLSFLEFKKACTTSEFPNRFARYVMEKGDVYHWPMGPFHVVTKADLAKQVLKSEDFSADRSSFFLSRMPNMDLRLITDFFNVVRKMMVMSDGVEHASRRKAAALGFDDAVLERFEKRVETTVQTLLEKAFAKKQIEFVSEIALQLPSTVLADLFAIPEEDRVEFFRRSNKMTAFFGGASKYENPDGIEVNNSASQLRDYFQNLISERRKNPGEDYISSLIHAQEIFKLTDEELTSQAIMMLVAGQVTTTDQICNHFYQLAQNPDLQLTLRESPELLPAALEEMNRFDPAVTFLFRVSKKDQWLGGQLIQAGETVFISSHAVNRDLGMESPFRLDLRRPMNVQHFAFGQGSHYCLGAKLGRLQMKALFHLLITERPFFSLDTARSSLRDHYSLAFSGFKEIHVETL